MSATPSPRAPEGDPASGDQAAASIRHRPSWIAFVVLGAIFCVSMGVWQFSRYQEASGTVQNLGYTFMWPFLGGFLIYAYLKYVRLEADEADHAAGTTDAGASPAAAGSGADAADHDDEDDDDVVVPPGGSTPATGARRRPSGRTRRGTRVVTEIPADLLPSRRPQQDTQIRDEGLAAYNSYLAELAREDGLGDRSQEKPAT